jgi:hypothetical protein
VRNRHTVHNLRRTTGRDYFPWTLMDDWQQPTIFVLQTLHGVAMYYGIGETKMRQWARAGYPVEASMDIVHTIRAMRFPQATVQGAAAMVPAIYPDFATNNRSTGYHLLHVLATLESAQFPDVRHLPWEKFHESAYEAVVSVAAHARVQSNEPTEQPTAAGARRRLFATVTHQQSRPPPSSQAQELQCNQDDSGACIHCAVLQKFLTGFKMVSVATADYYNDVYPKQVSYFKKVVSFAQRPGAQATSKAFNFVPTAQHAQDAKLPFQELPANMTYTGHQVHAWPTTQDVKDFLVPRQNLHVPVPFFGHSLWYYLQYPLRPCKTWDMAYNSCKKPKYTVGDAATMTGHMVLAVEALAWLTGISLPFMVKMPAYAMLYMIFRYDYVPRCLPILPWCLVIDLQTLVEGLFPPHLCQLVPGLVTSGCSPGLEEAATYRSCPRNELGILNPFFFFWRWKLPTLFAATFRSGDWGPAVDRYLAEIEQHEEPTPLQTTCLHLAIFDVVIVLVMLVVAARMVVPVMRAAAKSVVTSAGSIAIAGPYLLQSNYAADVLEAQEGAA